MDLTFSADEQVFRAEARAWLEANVPADPLPSGDTAEGFAAHLDWERRLYDERWVAVSWPEEYGGRGATLWEWLIFEEEYWRAGAPNRVNQNGLFLLAPSIFAFGTDEQKARFLPGIASSEYLFCQGWSEPNAGSDLAGITSRAVRDDTAAGWRLTGQKTWTTRGAFCNWLFGLFRSDPEAERHRGLTYFLVPLDADGVTVRPVGRLDGDDGFAEVFLEDVLVTDDLVLGEVDGGWKVAMSTTSSERGLSLRSPGRFLAAAGSLADLYRDRRSEADPGLRDAVVRAWMDADAYRLHTFRTVTRMTDGDALGAEASFMKLFWSELDVSLHEAALGLLGVDAELDIDGWMKGYQFSLAGPIYAGTNEIQRNVVAERVLGLPR
ncbi:MAG: acyl-CoA dehydrogenase family protein [Acidimicrobiia bacterium]